MKNNFKKIFIACDHAGLPLKKLLLDSHKDLPWVDLGTNSEASVDYPDYAKALAIKMQESTDDCVGVLICGSGQGMAIRANRYPFIRAALCYNTEIAEMARAHNNANVLCMGARFLDIKTANDILHKFLTTPFEGGRHDKRVAKLSE